LLREFKVSFRLRKQILAVEMPVTEEQTISVVIDDGA